jgi:hypothetical protein
MPTVLARRIIVVSPDEAFGQQLAAGLRTVPGTIDVHHMVEVIDAIEPPALWVIHLLDGAPSERLSRLAGGGPVIAMIPRPDLAAVVDVMQTSDRVAGVMIAEGFDPRRFAAMATRILADDLFGLEHVMAPGTPVHSQVVSDYQGKSRCISRVTALVEQVKVPRKYRAPIEQCIDEMVMNALYDAPVDVQGNHLFSGIPTRARITMRTDQGVVVRYACDGKQFAVSVRDAFGTLERSTVLRYLRKCLHAEQQIDRKAGGAGLGLYLVVNASTAVTFHVVPGIATEVLCLFDLEAPILALEQLDFVQRDPAGRRAIGSRRLPAGPRFRGQILAMMMVTIVVLVGLLANQALRRGRGGAALAAIELDSQPTGAAVEIDGRPMGSTPLTLTSLEPGKPVVIAFKRTGYRAATVRLEVPGVGNRKRVVQPLEISDEFVRVRFVSSPPGAEVVEEGQPASVDHTYTPAEVFVEANRIQRFTLTMPKHVPLVIEPFTPGRGAHELEKGGDLVEGATLHIEASLDGKVTVSGAPHCTAVTLPIDCTLAPGSYVVAYLGPDNAKIARTVTMAARDAIEKFALGVIEAGPGKLLQPAGSRKIVVEAGTHTITVSDDTGTHKTTVIVRPAVTVIAN